MGSLVAGLTNPWLWGPTAAYLGYKGVKGGLGLLGDDYQVELPDQLDPELWPWWQKFKAWAEDQKVDAIEALEGMGWLGLSPEKQEQVRRQQVLEMRGNPPQMPHWVNAPEKYVGKGNLGQSGAREPTYGGVPYTGVPEEEEDPWDSYLNAAMMASLGQAMVGKTATPAPVSLSGPASASWTEPMPMAAQTDYRYI